MNAKLAHSVFNLRFARLLTQNLLLSTCNTYEQMSYSVLAHPLPAIKLPVLLQYFNILFALKSWLAALWKVVLSLLQSGISLLQACKALL